MPVYCYSTEAGDTVELFYPMGEAPRTIRRDGATFYRDIVAEHSGFRSTPGNWPLRSDAAGVHPSQVRDAENQAKALGVPTRFDREGSAIFESQQHRKAYCEAVGLYDKDGGYGDPQRHS